MKVHDTSITLRFIYSKNTTLRARHGSANGLAVCVHKNSKTLLLSPASPQAAKPSPQFAEIIHEVIKDNGGEICEKALRSCFFPGRLYGRSALQFGPFTSRNLTPEANGLPAGLTFEQFQDALTKGTDIDKKHPQMGPLLQVMPWPAYQNMSTRQIRAIYEYLSSIPPVTVPGLP